MKSHKNLKNNFIDGALAPWFRGRRMASLPTSNIRAYVERRRGRLREGHDQSRARRADTDVHG